MKKVYLINPIEADVGYFKWPNDEGGLTDYVYIADLATTTVARLMEPYFEVEICEASLYPINYDTDADFIAITGKISQWNHMKLLSLEFKKRGKTVIIGGSYASLSFEKVRPFCDILIRGEIEEIADQVFSEISSGNWKAEYIGTQPDMSFSPVPRWDLYPNERALMGSIQISRGCPFQCEFCDVIEYLGRKQRHKPIENIIKELDALYKFGYREAFIADDNLTVYRKKAKGILKAVGDWNRKQPDGPMLFRTQVSIDIARDEEMLELCTYSGLFAVFIGIETPNVESLKETRKFQNLQIDLVDQIHKVFEHGLSIYGGMIVGFDNDTPQIFERQFEFVTESSIPYVTYGLLNAPDQTPLYDRLNKANRLILEKDGTVAGNAYETNIDFKNISKEEAQIGSKWLMNNMYAPDNFGDRLCKFIELLGGTHQIANLKTFRSVNKELFKIIRKVKRMGDREAIMHERVIKMLAKNPHANVHALNYLALYASIRATMNLNKTWDQNLVAEQPFEYI
ncbi:radical SAM protein [Ekhidna sp.]|uniref:radical SAM protein n=1 Tax=Ekhidna sp. TaxID=2608089 RepID=UPI003B514649